MAEYNDFDSLSKKIKELERRIRTQETAPRLSASSIDSGTLVVNSGAQIIIRGEGILDNASLNAYNEAGDLVQRIGKQPDGSYGVVIVGGQAPPQPSDPIVTSTAGGLNVRWDGLYAQEGVVMPETAITIEVHVSTEEVFTPTSATLVYTSTDPQGFETFVSLPADPYYVLLLVRSNGGVASEPSNIISATPQGIVDTDELNAALAPLEDLPNQVAEAVAAVDDAVAAANNAQTAADNAVLAANGKNKNTFSEDEPDPGYTGTDGDVWYQISGSLIIGQWEFSGGVWNDKTIDNAVISNLNAGKINAGTLDADRIGANAITSVKISAEAITAAKIAADAVTADKILAGSITTAKLGALAVTADKIAANSITAGKLESILTLSSKIVAGVPTGSRVELGSFGLRKYATNGTTVEVDFTGAEAVFSGKVVGADIIGSTLRTAQTGARIEIDTISGGGGPDYGSIEFYRTGDDEYSEPWGNISVTTQVPGGVSGSYSNLVIRAGVQTTLDDLAKSGSLNLLQSLDSGGDVLDSSLYADFNNINLYTRRFTSSSEDQHNGVLRVRSGLHSFETKPKGLPYVSNSAQMIHEVYTLAERDTFVQKWAEDSVENNVNTGLGLFVWVYSIGHLYYANWSVSGGVISYFYERLYGRTGPTSMTYQTGYVVYQSSGFEGPTYALEAGNRVQIGSGWIGRSGANVAISAGAAYTTIVNPLPVGYRPVNIESFIGAIQANGTTGVCNWRIAPTGVVTMVPLISGTLTSANNTWMTMPSHSYIAAS